MTGAWHGAPIDREEQEPENELEKQGAFTSFIREPAQNSTDNRVNPDQPVLMRFTSKTVPKGDVEKYFGDTWVSHITSCPSYRGVEDEDGEVLIRQDEHANGAYRAYSAGEEIPVMLVEDFNTTGLAGDVEFYQKKTSDPLTAEIAANTFYWFLRTLGVSSHKQGRGGSWGLGKLAFPLASMVRTFFVVTTRENNSRFLAGQAKLEYRTYQETEYHKMFYFANNWANGKHHHWKPVSDGDEIDEFVDAFGLERGIEDIGTSFVIPYPNNSEKDKVGTLEAVKCGIVSNYALGIMQGVLALEFVDSEGNNERIDKDNLKEKIENDEFDWSQLPSDLITGGQETNLHGNVNPSYTTKQRMLEQIALGEMVFKEEIDPDDGIDYVLNAPTPDSDFSTQFSTNNPMPERGSAEFEELKNAYDGGKYLRLRCQIPTTPKTSDSEMGEVIVVLRQQDHDDTEPYYYRSQISLPLVKDKKPSRTGLSSIVFTGLEEEDPFAKMMRQAEGPAHLKWVNGERLRKLFNRGAGAIKYIRDLPDLIVNHLSATAAAAKPFMSDKLSISSDAGDGDGGDKKKREVVGDFMFKIEDLDNNEGFTVSKITGGTALAGREFLLRIGYPKPLNINWKRKPDHKVMNTTLDISTWDAVGCELTQLKHTEADAGKQLYPDRIKVKITDENFTLKVANLDKFKKAKLKFDQWEVVSEMKAFDKIAEHGGDE